MCSQQSIDALCSATYLEDFLDCVDTLPNQIQRHVSEIRRLDSGYFDCMKKMKLLKNEYWDKNRDGANRGNNASSVDAMPSSSEAAVIDSIDRRRQNRGILMKKLKYLLLQSQHIADGKLAELAFVTELIDMKARQLEHDGKNMELDECDIGVNGKLVPANNTDASTERPIRSIMRGYIRGEKDRFTQLNSSQAYSEDIPNTRPEKHPSGASLGSIGAAVLSAIASEAESEAASPSTSSSVAPFADASCSGSTSRQANKRPRRQKQFPDFVRTELDAAMTSLSALNSHDVSGSTSPATSVALPAAPLSANQRGNKERLSGNANATQSNRRKKKKQKPDTASSGNAGKMKFNLPVDPDEPTYCLCEQVSYGEMIGCDNSDCDVEWFHFNCVGLTSKPKGKWFCPNCRGDRPNVMKSYKSIS